VALNQGRNQGTRWEPYVKVGQIEIQWERVVVPGINQAVQQQGTQEGTQTQTNQGEVQQEGTNPEPREQNQGRAPKEPKNCGTVGRQ